MSESNLTKLIQSLFFGLLLVVLIVFAIKVLRNKKVPAVEHNKSICLQRRETEFKGVVLENIWSRGSFISKLNNGNLYRWWCKSKVRDIIEVGDSIYKPSGTFDTYIYKNANPDSVIFVECDFDCDYWEKRYGKE
ncbi:MAG: hypothetical protein JXB00_08495 [Bacteroidales bacterium]|nr:hypothetical protein [Bacteroidales bacterium]